MFTRKVASTSSGRAVWRAIPPVREGSADKYHHRLGIRSWENSPLISNFISKNRKMTACRASRCDPVWADISRSQGGDNTL